MYIYLQDADHGWLIVSRADLDAAGLSPSDFSTWSDVCGDTFALDEYGDMPKFLKRLDERGVPYRLHDRRTKGDAHVRQYWLRNARPAPKQADQAERNPDIWTRGRKPTKNKTRTT
jgi:hypothetical protein